MKGAEWCSSFNAIWLALTSLYSMYQVYRSINIEPISLSKKQIFSQSLNAIALSGYIVWSVATVWIAKTDINIFTLPTNTSTVAGFSNVFWSNFALHASIIFSFIITSLMATGACTLAVPGVCGKCMSGIAMWGALLAALNVLPIFAYMAHVQNGNAFNMCSSNGNECTARGALLGGMGIVAGCMWIQFGTLFSIFYYVPWGDEVLYHLHSYELYDCGDDMLTLILVCTTLSYTANRGFKF